MDNTEYSQTIRGELRAELLSAEFWGLLFDGLEDITKSTLQLDTDSNVRVWMCLKQIGKCLAMTSVHLHINASNPDC